jgi:hypothetical protein
MPMHDAIIPMEVEKDPKPFPKIFGELELGF